MFREVWSCDSRMMDVLVNFLGVLDEPTSSGPLWPFLDGGLVPLPANVCRKDYALYSYPPGSPLWPFVMGFGPRALPVTPADTVACLVLECLLPPYTLYSHAPFRWTYIVQHAGGFWDSIYFIHTCCVICYWHISHSCAAAVGRRLVFLRFRSVGFRFPYRQVMPPSATSPINSCFLRGANWPTWFYAPAAMLQSKVNYTIVRFVVLIASCFVCTITPNRSWSIPSR